MICEKCGKEHDGSYGSGRFCSSACAKSRVQTEEINAKRSNTFKIKYVNHNKKPKICKVCGQIDCNNSFCKTGNKLEQIKTLVKYFGFDESVIGTLDVFDEWDRIRNILYKLYILDKKSSTEIAKMYNYPSPCNLPGKVFIYLNIPRKSCRESCIENILLGRWESTQGNPKFKCGWYKTWFNDYVYLRSSYEFDYARFLDENKIYYQVESLRIIYYDSQRCLDRISIPDFYIPHLNEIIEIKSTFTFDKVNMIDKAKFYIKNGYNFKLVLNHEEYSYEDLLLI